MTKFNIKNHWLIGLLSAGFTAMLLFVASIVGEQRIEIAQLKQDQNQTTIYKDKIVYKDPKDVVLTITIDDIKSNLLMYKSLSNRQRAEIITGILKYTKKYDVPFFPIYIMMAKESSFSPVSTAKLVKGKKGRGRGLANIILEYHPELITDGIVEKSGDLYNIDRAIEALAHIYKTEMNKPILKGSKTKHDSGQRRFFGVSKSTAYSDDVRKKIGEIVFAKIYK